MTNNEIILRRTEFRIQLHMFVYPSYVNLLAEEISKRFEGASISIDLQNKRLLIDTGITMHQDDIADKVFSAFHDFICHPEVELSLKEFINDKAFEFFKQLRVNFSSYSIYNLTIIPSKDNSSDIILMI